MLSVFTVPFFGGFCLLDAYAAVKRNFSKGTIKSRYVEQWGNQKQMVLLYLCMLNLIALLLIMVNIKTNNGSYITRQYVEILSQTFPAVITGGRNISVLGRVRDLLCTYSSSLGDVHLTSQLLYMLHGLRV